LPSPTLGDDSEALEEKFVGFFGDGVDDETLRAMIVVVKIFDVVTDEPVEVGSGPGNGAEKAYRIINIVGIDREDRGALDDQAEKVDLVLEPAWHFSEGGGDGLPDLFRVEAMLEGVEIASGSARAACWGLLIGGGRRRREMGVRVHRKASFPGVSPNTPPEI
jgi:hypothetical protein